MVFNSIMQEVYLPGGTSPFPRIILDSIIVYAAGLGVCALFEPQRRAGELQFTPSLPGCVLRGRCRSKGRADLLGFRWP